MGGVNAAYDAPVVRRRQVRKYRNHRIFIGLKLHRHNRLSQLRPTVDVVRVTSGDAVRHTFRRQPPAIVVGERHLGLRAVLRHAPPRHASRGVVGGRNLAHYRRLTAGSVHGALRQHVAPPVVRVGRMHRTVQRLLALLGHASLGVVAVGRGKRFRRRSRIVALTRQQADDALRPRHRRQAVGDAAQEVVAVVVQRFLRRAHIHRQRRREAVAPRCRGVVRRHGQTVGHALQPLLRSLGNRRQYLAPAAVIEVHQPAVRRHARSMLRYHAPAARVTRQGRVAAGDFGRDTAPELVIAVDICPVLHHIVVESIRPVGNIRRKHGAEAPVGVIHAASAQQIPVDAFGRHHHKAVHVAELTHYAAVLVLALRHSHFSGCIFAMQGYSVCVGGIARTCVFARRRVDKPAHRGPDSCALPRPAGTHCRFHKGARRRLIAADAPHVGAVRVLVQRQHGSIAPRTPHGVVLGVHGATVAVVKRQHLASESVKMGR